MRKFIVAASTLLFLPLAGPVSQAQAADCGTPRDGYIEPCGDIPHWSSQYRNIVYVEDNIAPSLSGTALANWRTRRNQVFTEFKPWVYYFPVERRSGLPCNTQYVTSVPDGQIRLCFSGPTGGGIAAVDHDHGGSDLHGRAWLVNLGQIDKGMVCHEMAHTLGLAHPARGIQIPLPPELQTCLSAPSQFDHLSSFDYYDLNRIYGHADPVEGGGTRCPIGIDPDCEG